MLPPSTLTLASVALLAPLVVAQNYTLTLQSSNSSLNGVQLSLSHVEAAGSYAVAPTAAQVATDGLTPSNFFFAHGIPLSPGGPILPTLLETSDIFGGAYAVPCAVQLIPTTNAGPLTCAVEVNNSTGNYYTYSSDTSLLDIAGIVNYWICIAVGTNGFPVNSTVVGSTDGNIPTGGLSPNGVNPWFENCVAVDGGIVPVLMASGSVSSSSATATLSSASVSQIAGGGVQTTTPATVSTVVSATASMISSATSSAPFVSQISDGQIQATTPATVSTVVSATASMMSSATSSAPFVSQISDGQIQATTPVTVATVRSATTTGPVVSQISDGQIQATTPVSASPVMFTGAANLLNVGGRDIAALAAGAAVFAFL